MSEKQFNTNIDVFQRLRGITNELLQKLSERLELYPNPSQQDLENFSVMTTRGELQGSVKTFSGSEINWLVHQCAYQAETGFNYTTRLVIWLGSHTRVPHLAFEFGTPGDLLFYMDYISRTDLSSDLEYLDRYYEPMNKTYLNFQADSRFQPFVSKSTYVRQVLSPTSLCFTCPLTNETLDFVSNTAYEMMERWLRWVEEAEPVPEKERVLLSQRDLIIRRTVAERDPGNEKASAILGSELAHKIFRALCGETAR